MTTLQLRSVHEVLRPARGDGLSVCLVRPPAIMAPRSLSYYGAVPDLGLAYVAAAARVAGHRVSVVDAPGEAIDTYRPYDTAVGALTAQGLSIAEIVERIPRDADVVGFAHMFLHEWGLLRTLLPAVRRRVPEALLVVGGENATAYWRRMLDDCPALDACVVGEGESAFCELLSAVQTGAPLASVPSLALRRDGHPVLTHRAPRITQVDQLPTPAWDLFHIDAYLRGRHGSGVDRGLAMPILTSRGCPYQCTFCSSPTMWTTRYVRRDPERVLDEIEALIATYAVTNVNVNDLTSMLTKGWILEFCDAVEARGLQFTWQLPSGTRSEAVDREAAERMYSAGCRNFCYAPESGSPDHLRRIKKRVKLPALKRSMQGALDAGMRTHASIIVGIPGEEPADLLSSWQLALNMAVMGLHGLSVLVFAPYPGSADYDALDREGRIAHDEAYLYGSLLRSAGSFRSYHPDWGGRTLWSVQFAMLLSFYGLQYGLRPVRAAQVVGNLWRDRQDTVMDQFLAAKIGTARRRLRSLGKALRRFARR